MSQGIRHAPFITSAVTAGWYDSRPSYRTPRPSRCRTSRTGAAAAPALCFPLQSCLCHDVKDRTPNADKKNGKGLVENNGFEPLTPCLQSRCSSQLS